MKKLLTILLIAVLFTACEKQEDVNQCWHWTTYDKMWQIETDLSGNTIISKKEIWVPAGAITYCESDGYSQAIIERRIEMSAEKKKIVCYP